MVKTTYFEEYEIGAAHETLGRTMTEAAIVAHAGRTDDFFPHHVDAEWSKRNAFGQRIAHGTLILSVGAGMTAGEINPVAFSYGYDRMRFIRPVCIGDTTHVRFTVSDKREYPRRASHGLVVERLEAVNQHGRVVLACEHLFLVERKAGAAGSARTAAT